MKQAPGYKMLPESHFKCTSVLQSHFPKSNLCSKLFLMRFSSLCLLQTKHAAGCNKGTRTSALFFLLPRCFLPLHAPSVVLCSAAMRCSFVLSRSRTSTNAEGRRDGGTEGDAEKISGTHNRLLVTRSAAQLRAFHSRNLAHHIKGVSRPLSKGRKTRRKRRIKGGGGRRGRLYR